LPLKRQVQHKQYNPVKDGSKKSHIYPKDHPKYKPRTPKPSPMDGMDDLMI
jgi:hypothetical protein